MLSKTIQATFAHLKDAEYLTGLFFILVTREALFPQSTETSTFADSDTLSNGPPFLLDDPITNVILLSNFLSQLGSSFIPVVLTYFSRLYSGSRQRSVCPNLIDGPSDDGGGRNISEGGGGLRSALCALSSYCDCDCDCDCTALWISPVLPCPRSTPYFCRRDICGA